eukprot:8992083-Alexandrium_andersonii.AAC.1
MPGTTWSWRTTAVYLLASTSITARRLLGRGCGTSGRASRRTSRAVRGRCRSSALDGAPGIPK